MAMRSNLHTDTDPATFDLDMIVAILSGNARMRFFPIVAQNVVLPENVGVTEFALNHLEKYVEQDTRNALVNGLYRERQRRLDAGKDFDNVYALHYLDTILNDALLSSTGSLYGTPSGSMNRSSQVMKNVIGGIVNDVLRRIYFDLCLYNLPRFYQGV